MAAAVEAKKQTGKSTATLSMLALTPEAQQREMIRITHAMGIRLNTPEIKKTGTLVAERNAKVQQVFQHLGSGELEDAERVREQARELGRDFWDSQEGQVLQDAINTQVYEAFRATLPDSEASLEKAERIFTHSLQIADSAIESMVAQLGGKAETTIGLLDETKHAKTPADFAKYLLDDTITPRLQFELWRKLHLAMVASAINSERESDQVIKMHARVEDYIREELFFGEHLGDAKPLEIETVQNGLTGEVLWIKGLHSDAEKEVALANGDTVDSIFPIRTRSIMYGTARIISLPRVKDEANAVLKAVSRAADRQSETDPGNIDIRQDVKDHVGRKIVVLDADSPNHPKVNLVIGQLKADLALRFKLTPEQTAKAFRDDRETNDNSGNNHNFIRIQFRPPEVTHYEEIIIEDVLTYFNNEYNNGELADYNVSFNGHSHIARLFNGPAHGQYENRRLGVALGKLFPEAIYDPNGEHDLSQVLLESLESASWETAERLLGKSRKNQRRRSKK